MKIEEFPIRVSEIQQSELRKLKVRWSPGTLKDLRAFHNLPSIRWTYEKCDEKTTSHAGRTSSQKKHSMVL